MAELRTLVEHEMERGGSPSYSLDDLARRRDRKRRNRRIAAGAVGLAIAVLVLGGLLRELALDRSKPADETPTPAPTGTVTFESSLYGYSVEIPSDWTTSAANIEWMWGESLDEGGSEFQRRDDHLSGPESAISLSAMAIPQDMTEDEWLDHVEALATERCDEPLVEPIQVDGATGRLVGECGTLFFVSAGRGYRVFGSEESLRWISSTIQLETEPPRDPLVSADAWRGIWPQTTREEAEAAQAGANAGDSAYTWQTRANPAEGQGAAVGVPIATRFVEEQLGWDSYWMARGGGNSEVWELIFVRCAPDRTNTAYPSFPCAPTDGNRFPTALVRIERLVEPVRGGIWVVTRGEEISPFEQAVPPTEQEVRDLVTRFAEARIAGEGAEAFLPEYGRQVPLLYSTSSGAPFERFEVVDVGEPNWPYVEVSLTLRMLASGGDVVVEQRVTVWPDGTIEGGWGATENGKPVDYQAGVLGGRVTFAAPNPPWGSPWFVGVTEGTELILTTADEGNVSEAAYFVVLGDPWLPQPGCAGSPASADELVRGIVESPDLQASAPVVTTVGGVDALRLDVVPSPGGETCDGWPKKGVPVVISHEDDHPFSVREGFRMRAYVLELPGEPQASLAVLIIASAGGFDQVVEAAAPIIDSIRFDEG